MLLRTALATLLLTWLLQSPAHAVKLLVRMSPPIESEAFVFESKPLENGKVRIRIKRNPAKSTIPTNPNLHLVRGASLRVSGEAGFVVNVSVAPHTDNQGWLVYSFVLDPHYLPYSQFTLAETDDSKTGTGYIGGGTIYEFALTESGGRAAELKKLIESIKTPELDAKEIEKLRESVNESQSPKILKKR